MPAKDNDPKARKTPAKARAKTTEESTSPAIAPIEAEKAPARSRRRSAAADAVTSGAEDATIDAPKRRRSVRRTEAVSAASSEAAPSADASPESAAPLASSSTLGDSFEREVRLRAYLIYAERGYHSESPESDWFQAEREVTYGRQA